MATRVAVELSFSSNGTPILRQITEGVKETASETNKARDVMQGFFQGIGQGMGQDVFRALKSSVLEFSAGAIQAQDESLRAINALNLALANQGNLYGTNSQQLQELASTLQSTTRFSDEAVLGVEATLATFGASKSEIDAATRAALDFATATGKDLPAAAEMLGKAYAGNTAALQKLGFHFTDGASSAQKFQEALAQINTRFGGAAAADAATYSGQVQQLKNAFGDAQESLGKFLGFMLSNGEKPFTVMLGAAHSLRDFLGRDLPVALSEFQARWLEMTADITEAVNKKGSGAASATMFGPLSFLNSLKVDNSKELATALREQATQIRAAGDAAAAASGKTLDFANQNKRGGDSAELTAKQLKEQHASLAQISDILQGRLDRVLAEASEKMKDLGEAAKSANLDDMTLTMNDVEGAASYLVDTVDLTAGSLANLKELEDDAAAAAKRTSGEFRHQGEDLAALHMIFADTASILQSMGADSRSFGVTFATSMATSMQASFSFRQAWHEAGTDTVKQSAAIVGALQAVAAQATQTANTTQRALQGAASGAAAGAAVGGGWGAIGGAIGGGIAAYFSGPSWQHASEDAARVFNEAFGGTGAHISDELAQAIHETATHLNISDASASLLHLSEFVKRIDGDARQYVAGIRELIAGMASGLIPVHAGMEELARDWQLVRQAATDAGAVGDSATRQILYAARAAGTLTQEMRDFLSDLQTRAVGGKDTIAAGLGRMDPAFLQSLGQEWGLAAAGGFALGFQSEINQGGVVAALDKSGEQLHKVYDEMVAAGNTAGAAMLQPFIDLDGRLNENLRGMLQVNAGMDQVFTSMADSDNLSGAQFQLMQQNILDTDKALRDAGVSDQARIAATRQSLVDLAHAGQQYNMTLSEGAQALEAEGGMVPLDPMMQMVNLLSDIDRLLGGVGATGAATGEKVAAGTEVAKSGVSSLGTESSNSLAGMASDADDVTNTLLAMGKTGTDQGESLYIANALAAGALKDIATNAPLAGEQLALLGDDGTEHLSHTTEGTDLLGRSLHAAAGDAERLLAALLAMPGSVTTVTPPPVTPAALGWHGTVTRPTYFLTGEGGQPEDVNITPHSQRRAAGSGGRSAVAPVVNNFYLSTIDPRAAGSAVRRVMQSDTGGARTSLRKNRRG